MFIVFIVVLQNSATAEPRNNRHTKMTTVLSKADISKYLNYHFYVAMEFGPRTLIFTFWKVLQNRVWYVLMHTQLH